MVQAPKARGYFITYCYIVIIYLTISDIRREPVLRGKHTELVGWNYWYAKWAGDVVGNGSRSGNSTDRRGRCSPNL